MQSVVASPSSTLSSQHINLSKKRIQDYIRQLNKTANLASDDSNEASDVERNVNEEEEKQGLEATPFLDLSVWSVLWTTGKPCAHMPTASAIL